MAPELFTVPGLGWAITAYGLGVALALVTAWLTSLLLARQDRLPTEPLGMIFVLSAIAGLFAARAAYLVQIDQPVTFAALRSLPSGGMAVFGGLFAALVVTAIGCRRWKIPLLAWLDCAAPAVALGAIFERVGAFFAGGDFGNYVPPGDLGHALAVTYPQGSPAYLLHGATLQGLPGVSTAGSLPVHPVQLYLAVTCAVALAVGLWIRRRRRWSGQTFLAVSAVFLIGRAVLFEPLRYGASPQVLGPLRLQQISGLGLLLAIAVAASMLARRGLKLWEGGPWSPKA
jgi:phosphatidylglycerol:prolipoprotein diacylglycerol transferase